MPGFRSETRVIQAPWWAEEEKAEIRTLAYVDRKYLAAVYAQEVARLRDEGVLPPKPESETEEQKQLRMMKVPPQLYAEIQVHTIIRAVRWWTDAEGVRQPVTMEMARLLEDRDGDFILEEIQALSPRRSEEEWATFPGAAGDGGEVGDISG
jgi:hypothetical protein